MNTNDLTGNNPAATFSQILHIGTGTASVSTVRTGNGTATALSFVSGGAKITGTFEATGNTTVGGNAAVTGTLTVTGNATLSGSLTLGGIEVRPPVYKMLTADVGAATTTNVAITQWDFTPVSGATYEIEMFIIGWATATTTGLRIVNTSGAGTLVLASVGEALGITATGGTYASINAPAAGANYGAVLKGYFTASSTAALSWAIVSEVASSAVYARAGSILRITRIS